MQVNIDTVKVGRKKYTITKLEMVGSYTVWKGTPGPLDHLVKSGLKTEEEARAIIQGMGA